jgi:hypothetical protein
VWHVVDHETRRAECLTYFIQKGLWQWLIHYTNIALDIVWGLFAIHDVSRVGSTTVFRRLVFFIPPYFLFVILLTAVRIESGIFTLYIILLLLMNSMLYWRTLRLSCHLEQWRIVYTDIMLTLSIVWYVYMMFRELALLSSLGDCHYADGFFIRSTFYYYISTMNQLFPQTFGE